MAMHRRLRAPTAGRFLAQTLWEPAALLPTRGSLRAQLDGERKPGAIPKDDRHPDQARDFQAHAYPNHSLPPSDSSTRP